MLVWWRQDSASGADADKAKDKRPFEAYVFFSKKN